MSSEGQRVMTLRDYLLVLRRRKWIVIVPIVLAPIVAVVLAHRQPARYEASAQVTVSNLDLPSSVLDSSQSTQEDPVRLLATQAQFARLPAVAQRAVSAAGVPNESASDLLAASTVTPSQTDDFLTFTVANAQPARATRLATAYATEYVAYYRQYQSAQLAAASSAVQGQIQQLQREGRQSTPLYSNLVGKANQLTAAAAIAGTTGAVVSATHASPAGSNVLRDALLALVLALVVGLGLAFLRDALDTRVRSEVEGEYGLPLLASIPFSRKAQGAIRAGSGLPVALMERVRGLRTMLDHGAGSQAAARTVLVTSAIPGEGKSTLVKSLALAYFESAKSVLVIDADLRRPMLHEFFEAPLVPGLSDVLRSSILLPDAVQKVQSGDIQPAFDAVLAGSESAVSVVPQRAHPVRPEEPVRANVSDVRSPVVDLLASGSGTSDPAALLGSPQLKTLLTEAAATYDLVLIDSPPVLSVSDAIPLATAADAVIVVARSGFTTREAAVRCREALERVPTANILGVVANAVRNDNQLSREYYLP